MAKGATIRSQAARALAVAAAMGTKFPIHSLLLIFENMSSDKDGPQGNIPAPIR